MKNVLQYIKDNKNEMEPKNLKIFYESLEFNELDETSRKDIFYFVSFRMSTKEYKQLDEAIQDFIDIIDLVNDNEYLQNTNEYYAAVIVNYLNRISKLLFNFCFENNQEIFIDNFQAFTESLDKFCLSNTNCRKTILKELTKLYGFLFSFKSMINKEYEGRFKRYSDKLNSYISEQEKNNDFNEINEDDGNKTDIINHKENISNKESINNELELNNINRNIDDSSFEDIIKDHININEKFFNNSKRTEITNINQFSNNSNYNNFQLYNNNMINENVNPSYNDDKHFEIISNNSSIYSKKNLKKSKKYYDSIIFSSSISNIINDIVDCENKKEEEEKVREIDEEIESFIDEVLPIFNLNNINEGKLASIKKSYLKSEDINESKNSYNLNIDLNTFQNLNNNININNINKPKKKKKKGKKKKNNNQ